MSTIPLNIEKGIILLEVTLSGKKDFRTLKMILDTGATLTTIPSEIALTIGCDPTKSKRRIEMITASGIEYAPLIIIPKC